MARYVICPYCTKKFDRDKIPFVMVSSRRYAHLECAEAQEAQKNEEEKDKEKLEEYIKQLLKIDYIDARIRKQIKQYIEEYNYSYKGIHKSLVYFYEIKGGDIEKANGGIGIVPYIYTKARDYYYALWLAQQQNENKQIDLYIPNIKEYVIARPQREVKERRLFTFLEEEGN